jgi:molecular chaperone DnaJ
VEPDPRFERQGDDLITEVTLSYAQAALGANVKVPVVDGDDLDLDVEAGTQPGTMLVLRGRGMPNVHGQGKGDLGVRLQVAVPTRLSDEQRRLVEELAKLDPPTPSVSRREDKSEGFFFRKRKKR